MARKWQSRALNTGLWMELGPHCSVTHLSSTHAYLGRGSFGLVFSVLSLGEFCKDEVIPNCRILVMHGKTAYKLFQFIQ